MDGEERLKIQNENARYNKRIAGLEAQLEQHWTSEQSAMLTSLRIKVRNNQRLLNGAVNNPEYTPIKIIE